MKAVAKRKGHALANWLEAEQQIAGQDSAGEAPEYAEVIPLAGESELAAETAEPGSGYALWSIRCD